MKIHTLTNMMQTFLIFMLLCVIPLEAENEELLLAASRKVFATNDGSFLMGLSLASTSELNSQVRRILGIPADESWNTTLVRELSDARLTEMLLLALVGNFTSASSATWEQPCKIVIDPSTGKLQVSDLRSTTEDLLRVLLFALIILILKQLLENT